MKFFVLKKAVTIFGRTMCGFGKARATLMPPTRINGFDPIQYSLPGENTRNIDTDHARVKMRRICLETGRTPIDAIEHYTPLRFLFPGTCIMFEGGQTLPYITNTGTLFPELFKAADEYDVEVPWFTVKSPCSCQYPNPRNGLEAYTIIEPSLAKQLVIDVTIRFHRIGEHTERFTFPDISLTKEVLSVPSIGMPGWLKYPAKILWCHTSQIFWPERSDPEKALRTIARHRALDILGAIALMKPPTCGGFPSLNIRSQCSGHLADLKVLKMAQVVAIC